jgi:hypothetical protein
MDKVIQDGCVAVLISRGYGAGWYSWHNKLDLVFDSQIVNAVLENAKNWEDVVCDRVKQMYPDEHVVTNGVDGLEVQWVREGVEFEIREYDGAEWIDTKNSIEWIVA